MFQANLFVTFSASKGIKFRQLSSTLYPNTDRLNMHIFEVISLAIHSLVYAKILFNTEIRVDADGLIAERTGVHFFILFFVGLTGVGFYGGVVCAVDFAAVFALDGKPVFLLTDLEGAVFAYILIEHLK